MVFPFVLAAAGRRGAASGGKGLGRSRGRQPATGIAWDRNGEHAKQILRGYLSNDPHYLSWDSFKTRVGAAWIISATNPAGSYTLDNLRRNYANVLKRYHKHIDPNDPFDGQFGLSSFSSVLVALLLSLLSSSVFCPRRLPGRLS